MTTITVDKAEFKTDDAIRDKMIRLSLVEPTKYVTLHVGPKKVSFYYHSRKPGFSDGEETYRFYGGFYKAGRIVKPSPTFIKRFNTCPVLR